MKIGIDLDDTITDINKKFYDSAQEYLKLLKRFDKDKTYDRYLAFCYNSLRGKNELIKEFFGFSKIEMKFYIKNYRNKIAFNAKPRMYAKRVINKLFENNEIIIITSRSNLTYGNAYKVTEKWLVENNISYNKLITNIENKRNVCKREKIDIFIDDQLNNCLDVKETGIDVIRFSKDEYKDIKNLDNWEDVYKFIISKGKI